MRESSAGHAVCEPCQRTTSDGDGNMGSGGTKSIVLAIELIPQSSLDFYLRDRGVTLTSRTQVHFPSY